MIWFGIAILWLWIIIGWSLFHDTRCECGGTFYPWDDKKSICDSCGEVEK